MAKIGRNHPCPCGSGKKYKLCCLPKDEEAASAARAAQRTQPGLHAHDDPLCSCCGKPGLAAGSVAAKDAAQLDEMSNAVVDLVHEGKLDEAEQAARTLLQRFPEVHDGYDRLGMVYEARGDHKLAASYYRKVIDFVRQHQDDYDPEFADQFHRLAERLDPLPPT